MRFGTSLVLVAVLGCLVGCLPEGKEPDNFGWKGETDPGLSPAPPGEEGAPVENEAMEGEGRRMFKALRAAETAAAEGDWSAAGKSAAKGLGAWETYKAKAEPDDPLYAHLGEQRFLLQQIKDQADLKAEERSREEEKARAEAEAKPAEAPAAGTGEGPGEKPPEGAPLPAPGEEKPAEESKPAVGEAAPGGEPKEEPPAGGEEEPKPPPDAPPGV